MSKSAADLATRLAEIEQRLALQAATHRAELGTLRRQLARRQRNLQVRLLAAALIAALLLTPLGALAANFVDLNPGSGHNANINAIADAGITKGCFDTSHYCPNDLVTREQMASFLARTAGLGSNPPIANAKTAVTATNAANADQLGGQPATKYVRADTSTRIRYAPYAVVRLNSTIAITPQVGPSVMIGTSTTTGTQSVVLPLSVPAPLFGQDLDVIELHYCYKVSNSASRITNVQLVEGDSGEADVVTVDATDRSSTVADCVDIAMPAAHRVIDALYAQFDIDFGSTGHTVTLYAVHLLLARHTP